MLINLAISLSILYVLRLRRKRLFPKEDIDRYTEWMDDSYIVAQWVIYGLSNHNTIASERGWASIASSLRSFPSHLYHKLDSSNWGRRKRFSS